MIEPDELQQWSDRLGVSADQIRHDHLVSHLLATLPELGTPGIVFYGGTALCRTILDESRVSEDIDLLHAEPEMLVETLATRVPAMLRREFPRSTFDQATRNHDTWTSNLGAPGGLRVRVQITRLLPRDPWEFGAANVALRYSDLEGTVALQTPTPDEFVAMKGLAWHDRHAPRDLFDLAGLARSGYFTNAAARLIYEKASHGWILAEFERLPRSTIRDWEAQLAHQVDFLPEPKSLAGEVLSAIRTAATN